MKKLLFKLFGINKLLEQAYNKGAQEGVKEILEKHEMKKLQINYPVGTEVMHLSGQSPIQRATVVGHEKFGNQWHLALKDENGEQFMTLGKVLRFNENRYKSFQKLAWWEQHNVGTEWGPSFDESKAKNLEAGRPAWDNGE